MAYPKERPAQHQELEFHPYRQSLVESSYRWVWNADGMRVCNQVSVGQFQFLIWSDSWYPARFSWSLSSCGRKLTNGH